MKLFIGSLIAVFITELALMFGFVFRGSESVLDTVEVNEVMQSVRCDHDDLAAHVNETSLDYVVIDGSGNVLYKTREGLSEGINAAVSHRDTILDIDESDTVSGKVIIYNDSGESVKSDRNSLSIIFGISMAAQMIICVAYIIYLDRRVIKPFQKMKGFAERVAGGDLDVPLEMDRGNIFGAFTESFDIMRSELKKARIAEAEANRSKKELVAKLSHDIRTPVASIKAVSELGAAVSLDEKTRSGFKQIIRKSDQITTLVGNLFSATLEELQQLTVTPAPLDSTELSAMLESSDYFRKANIPDIPECVIYADKLRLQQVFDNIFSNSYKYANTEIDVKSFLENGKLVIEIEDRGGVQADEPALLKEKFRRGENSVGIDGAGLGLYISDRFMAEMNGELILENGENGLKNIVVLSLA